MDGLSPWRKLRQLGGRAPWTFAVLPPIVLDRISTDWLLGPGNHLLTHYKTIVTTEHVLYRLFLTGGVVGAPMGMVIFEGLKNIKISAFPEALLGSQFGFGIGIFVACRIMPLFNMLAESPLRSLLGVAALVFIPAIGAGVVGAYYYETGKSRETPQTVRQSSFYHLSKPAQQNFLLAASVHDASQTRRMICFTP